MYVLLDELGRELTLKREVPQLTHTPSIPAQGGLTLTAEARCQSPGNRACSSPGQEPGDQGVPATGALPSVSLQQPCFLGMVTGRSHKKTVLGGMLNGIHPPTMLGTPGDSGPSRGIC